MGGKSKSTTKPWGPAQAPIMNAQANLANTFNANQPQLQANANTVNSVLPGLAAKVNAGNPMVDAGKAYATNVLGGKYLNSNPHMDAMTAMARGSAMDNVNSLFGRAGRTGGNQHVESLGKGISEAELALRYGDYGQERDRMTQAAALTPNLAAAEYAPVGALSTAAMTGSQIPFIGADALARGTAGLLGQYTQTTQKKGFGVGDAIGLGLQAAAVFSDRRLKTNVEKVGELEDGLGVYEYDYTFGGPRQRGVMADEVAVLRPWALGPETMGYATVNYEAL